MIRSVRTVLSVPIWGIFVLLVFLLMGSFLASGEVRAQNKFSPKSILTDEIDRMLERTLPDEFSSQTRGILGRRIEDYRKALRQLRTDLKRNSLDRGRLFDTFESVLEDGFALREKQNGDVDDRLDRLREELEEHREAAKEAKGRLRADWIETYDRRLRPDDNLQRHQAVLLRAFGLVASEFVSSDDVYRFENALRMAERTYPYVLQELFETDAGDGHHTRLYVNLLDLLASRSPDLKDPSMIDRFRRHVRQSGGVILQLRRVGALGSVPKDLEETIRKQLNTWNE